MILATLAVLCGLVMLVWSADQFVDGATRTASYFRVPPDTDRHAGRAGGLDSARRAEGPSAGGPATQEGATAPSLDDEAAAIQPMSVETQLLSRDIPVMCVLTLALFVLGYNFGKSRPGRINRLEGCLLLASYIGYTIWLIESTFIRGA